MDAPALTPREEWARCRPWIEAAADAAGTHGIEDVEGEIAAGRAFFWPGKRCAAVTEFIDYPRMRVLNFWLLGGDLDELLTEMRPAIEAWGAANGCIRVVGEGRLGWGRVLKRHGYRELALTMGRDL